MQEQQYEELLNLITNQSIPFYKDTSFWISTLIGVIGVFFSIISYREAKEAKKAAKAAGNFVKIQSITIDLTEIIQRLDIISTELNYSHARDFFNELNRRIRRIISILSTNAVYNNKTSEILLTLNAIKNNLDDVRKSKTNEQSLAGIDIYFAIESEFSNLSGQLADLSGLLEQKTLQ